MDAVRLVGHAVGHPILTHIVSIGRYLGALATDMEVAEHMIRGIVLMAHGEKHPDFDLLQKA